jgi:hypothetical protein
MGAWDDDTSTQGMQSAIDAQTGITAQKTLADAGAASRAATPAKPAPNTLMHWMVDLPQNVSTGLLDTAVNTADAMHSAWQWGNDGQRQAMAKVSATDTSGYSPEQLQHYNAGRQGMGQPDTVDPMTEPGLMSARMGVNQEAYDAGNKERVANASAPSAVSPIYDHARDAVIGLRDHIAIQDPNMTDSLTQGLAQFAIPYLGYSKALAGVHGVANMVAAGAITDATAATAHQSRFADILQLGLHSEGKFGDVLQTLDGDTGGLFNKYIDYMTDRTSESEFMGHVKNVIDGLGAQTVLNPIIHYGSSALKEGIAGLRYSISNGASSADKLMPPPKRPAPVRPAEPNAP